MDDTIHEKFVEIHEQTLEVEGRILDLEKKAVEHDTRFSNGREVMGELREGIERLKPKAPDWMKLAGVALAFVTTLLAGHYWIVTQLNDRPTDTQIEKIMGDHGSNGHSVTNRDVSEIRSTQVEQKTILNTQATTLRAHGAKLDTIIERLPRRKNGEDD
jgi:hypothetical protein